MRGTILVTGGAGYIGSTVTKLLSTLGYKTLVFDNLSTGHEELVYKSDFYQGDLRDESSLKKVFKENKIDAVMHFAALSSVGESVRNPSLYYYNNVIGSLNLLAAMREFGVGKFVFSSTAAVYGVPEQVPIQEDSHCFPVNPYGTTKLTVERALADYFKAYGMSSVSLRYFNACGTEDGYEVGELHSCETHLIPLAVRAALDKGAGLSVFGTDYETKDGTCVRDYIHVSDLAEAHVKALEYLFKQDACLSLNLSNNEGFSVLEILRAVEKVSSSALNLKYLGRREGDPPVLIGSSEKTRQTLDWAPRYTEIESIIETAYKWQKTEVYESFLKRR